MSDELKQAPSRSALGKIDRHKKVALVSGTLQRFPMALLEVAKVSEFGCAKYQVPLGDRDFLRNPAMIEDATDALGRHLAKEITEGPVNTEDGDVLHAAQVAWNALARLECMLVRGLVQPARHHLPKPTTGEGVFTPMYPAGEIEVKFNAGSVPHLPRD